jgi:hypothetical protein
VEATGSSRVKASKRLPGIEELLYMRGVLVLTVAIAIAVLLSFAAAGCKKSSGSGGGGYLGTHHKVTSSA